MDGYYHGVGAILWRNGTYHYACFATRFDTHSDVQPNAAPNNDAIPDAHPAADVHAVPDSDAHEYGDSERYHDRTAYPHHANALSWHRCWCADEWNNYLDHKQRSAPG